MAAVLWTVGASLALILAPAVAAGVLAAVWLRSTAAGATLRALGSRPMAAGESPRLTNIVEGLCTTHGFAEPRIHIVETPAINCAGVGHGRGGGHLVVTSGALEELDRLELEAVIARQLCEMRRGVDSVTALARVGTLPGARIAAARLWRRLGEPRRAFEVDIEAVRLTCFPPALASALDKAARAPGAETRSAAGRVWLVAPEGTAEPGWARAMTLQRIDVLGEV